MLRARTDPSGLATLALAQLRQAQLPRVPLGSLEARRAAPGAIVCHHYVVQED